MVVPEAERNPKEVIKVQIGFLPTRFQAPVRAFGAYCFIGQECAVPFLRAGAHPSPGHYLPLRWWPVPFQPAGPPEEGGPVFKILPGIAGEDTRRFAKRNSGFHLWGR
jgi:hypothetical protein